MPQASDELRDKMGEYFGAENRISDHAPEEFLRSQGWTENRSVWHCPAGKTIEQVSQKEFDCIKFLIHEWDHDYAPRKKV
jgi:hypothetical protein